MKQQGFQAEGLHGDLSQAQRDVAMNRFRNGGASILIATDVAARGIDVDDVEAVINYDIPQDIEYYVHRIGRTGRAGRKGRSLLLPTAGKLARSVRSRESVIPPLPRKASRSCEGAESESRQISEQGMGTA